MSARTFFRTPHQRLTSRNRALVGREPVEADVSFFQAIAVAGVTVVLEDRLDLFVEPIVEPLGGDRDAGDDQAQSRKSRRSIWASDDRAWDGN